MRTLDSGSPEGAGPSGWESTVDERLRRLGVSFQPAMRDLDAALAQGFAAAGVVLGHRDVNRGPLLGAAHYLRGVACEANGFAAQAVDDCAMTLLLVPGHHGALAARNRLSSQRREAWGGH